MTNNEYYLHDLEEVKSYDDVEIISQGKVNGKIILKTLENCSKYFHIEIQECIYSHDNYTNLEWVDVEGIDYGWAWMRFEDDNGKLNKKGIHDHLASKIENFMNMLVNKLYEDHVYYVHMKTNEGECIRFYNQNNDGYVYNYRFSHDEIMY